jgi:two-component system chemotaxis sensor kinase CheA
MDTERLRSWFTEDSRQILQKLGLVIERIEDDGFTDANLREAARCAHSIKSEASFLDIPDLSRLAHAFEDAVISASKQSDNGGIPIVIDRYFALERFIDEFARERLSGKSENGDGARQPGAAEASAVGRTAAPSGEEWAGLANREKEILAEALRRGERAYTLSCELEDGAEMPGARLYLILNDLEANVRVIVTKPDRASVRNESSGLLRALVTTDQGEAFVRRSLLHDAVARVEVTALANPEAIAEEASDAQGIAPSGLLSQAPELELVLASRDYEELLLYADELAWMLSELGDEADARVAVELARRVRKGLQSSSARSLADLLPDLEHLVAELSGSRGRQVRLRSRLGSLKVYAPVAEVLHNCLVHMVRNAVDHGIEPPSRRSAAGKEPIGTISIEARQSEEEIELSVSDDGAGIEEHSVRQRYDLAYGSSSGKGLLDMLATPAFSTRERADEVSGRGVGLDIVKHNVETLLGGSLEVENRLGAGVLFRIRLPATRSLLSVLVFTHAEKSYAVPLAQVLGVRGFDRERLRTDRVGHIYFPLEGKSVRMLSVDATKAFDLSKVRHLILIRAGERRAFIAADSLISEETVVRRADRRHEVYSKTLEREVPLFVPVRI